MRERFNNGGYYERMKAGEFKAVRTRVGTPNAEILRDYGTDTVSVSVSYLNQNDYEIARVHQYESPDGQILYRSEDGVVQKGGFPDPKRLFEDGILYRIQSGKDFV